MRRTVICVIALTFSVAPGWSQTGAQTSRASAARVDHSADDEAISKLLEATQTALNSHDARALAETWATDGDLRAPTGELVKGRSAVEKYWSARFAGPFKNLKVTINPAGETRYLGQNVAIGNGSAEVTGAMAADGKDVPPYTALVTNVLVKRNGSWQVLSNRVWPANAIPGPSLPTKSTS
jgi:uncharacterized protein (TIGR02246 family)